MAIPRLENKNHARRYGANCAECGKKLGRFRIDGSIGGKRVGFCSFDCQDAYTDKVGTQLREQFNTTAAERYRELRQTFEGE